MSYARVHPRARETIQYARKVFEPAFPHVEVKYPARREQIRATNWLLGVSIKTTHFVGGRKYEFVSVIDLVDGDHKAQVDEHLRRHRAALAKTQR